MELLRRVLRVIVFIMRSRETFKTVPRIDAHFPKVLISPNINDSNLIASALNISLGDSIPLDNLDHLLSLHQGSLIDGFTILGRWVAEQVPGTTVGIQSSLTSDAIFEGFFGFDGTENLFETLFGRHFAGVRIDRVLAVGMQTYLEFLGDFDEFRNRSGESVLEVFG